MTSAAEHFQPVLSDGEAILNALPNPVLLVAPDGKIVYAYSALDPDKHVENTMSAVAAWQAAQKKGG